MKGLVDHGDEMDKGRGRGLDLLGFGEHQRHDPLGDDHQLLHAVRRIGYSGRNGPWRTRGGEHPRPEDVAGGFAGSSAYIGNNGAITYSAGGYALHVPEFTWNASTPAVHDITEFNSGSPPEWRTYMPDIFQNSARYVAGIDADTAIVFPPAPGAALPTFTMTYKSGATLAMTGLIQRVGPAIVRGQKNMATYDVLGSGTTTAVGGVFGSHTFGGTLNGDPLWSAGGSATGAIVVTAASGRTYSGTDSFWTSLQLQCTVGGAVMVSGSIQGCGTLTAA